MTVVHPNWDIVDKKIKEEVLQLRTFGYATDFLWPVEETYGKWWRSEDTVLSENPYTGFQSRRDWPLKEAMNLHFTHLQQESSLIVFTVM